MNQLTDQPHGLVSVAAAIIGKGIIAAVKFAGFFVSGLSALFSDSF